MEKFAADAFIHADRACHVVYVATDLVTEIRDLVDERNLRREKRIRSILRELSSFERSNDKWRFDQIQRAIQIFHDRDRFFVTTADNHTIRTHEIVNGRTFS